MSTIAVLGMGAMGSRMVQRLLESSHTVHIWNRSPEPLQKLTAKGAQAFATPKEAVAGVEIVIAMVSTDEASRTVWLDPEHGAALSLRAGMYAVESSTLTPAYVRELALLLEKTGAHFLDAPVSGTLPQIEQGQLVYVVGGAAVDVDAVRPVLSCMGHSIQHVGPHGAGATVKLTINAFLGAQLTSLAEILGLLNKSGIVPARAMEVLGETTALSPAAKAQGNLIATGSQTVNFSLDLMKKDFGYAVETGKGQGVRLPMTATALEVVSEATARGLGDKNMTALAELYL